MKIFLASQASNVLEDICKKLPKNPKDYSVAFIPTASNPYENPTWLEQDKEKLKELGFNLFEMDIQGKSQKELEILLKSIDIIFVAGGNTMFLLEKMKESGFDNLIMQFVKKGVIYIGSSAGSVIFAPDSEPSKFFDERKGISKIDTNSIGLIDFYPLPHYDNKKYKELNDKVIKEYKNWKYKIVPITDTQYFYMNNQKLNLIDVKDST